MFLTSQAQCWLWILSLIISLACFYEKHPYTKDGTGRRKGSRPITTITAAGRSDGKSCGIYEKDKFISNLDILLRTDTHLLHSSKEPNVSPPPSDRSFREPASTNTLHASIEQRRANHDKQIAPILQYLNSAYKSASPPQVIFPLAPDHHLITLVQYNVLRATITNMAILNILHTIPSECAIALTLGPSYDPPDTIPPSLYPTPTQLAIPHDAWIDSFPSAQMRDNLILNRGNYDPDELCFDTSGGLWEGFDVVDVRGMMIWGEPWMEEGWEITQGFVDKWAWILKGCDKMVEISNKWREQRGEERLIVEI